MDEKKRNLTAYKLMVEHGLETVFMNDKFEFFRLRSNALNSVDDKSKIIRFKKSELKNYVETADDGLKQKEDV